MIIPFEKYQGTGNDFIMIDNRTHRFDVNDLPIPSMCHRKFGIGADGVIVIENHPSLDFHMIYFNPDGSQSFCGNGSRCAVAYANSLGIINDETTFLSTDGDHMAHIQNGLVELKMHDVATVERKGNDFIINTGSPHYIQFVDNVENVDIVPTARAIRYNDVYKSEGINVNFVQVLEDGIRIRTYERGVEDETLSCGTGVTAAALAACIRQNKTNQSNKTKVLSQGGELSVSFTHTESGFSNIFLVGPAKKTFEGQINLSQF